VLRAIADRIEAATEDLAHLLTLEGGKPLRDSKAEISLLVATIREVASINLAVEVIEDSDSNRVEAHFRPYGVVAAIVPWNFPLGLIGNKLPPALLAGNTLVVRPASSTPLSAVLMGEIIADVVPPGVINVICDMPAKRELSMRQLRHLLRLHHGGVSAREIGRSTKRATDIVGSATCFAGSKDG
jgi:acyl-CoA reductase-like NAD-dependent aldehyde dehydrogenase